MNFENSHIFLVLSLASAFALLDERKIFFD